MVLLVLLFPALALGGEVKLKDLVITNGLYFNKFTNIPFTGKVTGKEQGSFKDGKRVGVWIVCDSKGRVSKEVTYENGKKVTWVQYKYHSNGQLRTKETYKDGKFDGPWVRYYDNGQLELKGTFKDVKFDGPWVGYYANGQLGFKGTYKDGNVDGPWIKYYENGQLRTKETYKDDKFDGPRVDYHENGQLLTKGTYKDGNKKGLWVGYHRDGTVDEELTETYKDGVRVSD